MFAHKETGNFPAFVRHWHTEKNVKEHIRLRCRTIGQGQANSNTLSAQGCTTDLDRHGLTESKATKRAALNRAAPN